MENTDITAVTGLQWGDEGTASVVSFLSGDADLVIRPAGSNMDRKGFMPSGHTNPECMNIMSAGCAVDLSLLRKEMDTVRENTGLDLDNVFLDERTVLIMPWNRAAEDAGLDAERDRLNGIALRAADLLDDEVLLKSLGRILEEKNVELRAAGLEAFSLTDAANQAKIWKGEFADHIIDTLPAVRYAVEGGDRIILEADGGFMNDLLWGTYPWTGTSATTAQGAAASAGIPGNAVTKVIGVMNAYSAAEGDTPFPTEIADGTYLALKAKTGRERLGWLDLIALDTACSVNGATELAVTDLSALDGIGRLRVCTGYMVQGEYYMNLPETRNLAHARPIYDELDGWSEDTASCTSYEQLPANAKKYIEKIEEFLDRRVTIITAGSSVITR